MIARLTKQCSALRGGSGLARSVAVLAGAAAIAQLITLFAMPVVTRLYTPADIGVLTLFLSFFSIWAAMLSLRFESALLVATDIAESRHLFQLAGWCVLFISLLACPVLLLGHHFGLMGLELLPWWAALVAVPVLAFYGWFMLLRAVALREGLFAPIGTATIVRSGANAAARVACGLGGLGAVGLFFAEFAGAIAPAFALSSATRGVSPITQRSRAALSDMRHVMRKYAKFPQFELPSVIVNQIATALPVPILASLHGAEAAGWYGLAAMLVALPNAQIGKAVGDTFQMEFSRRYRAGRFDDARRLFRNVVMGLAAAGVVPYAAIMLLAPLLITPLFGSQWSEMASIAVALSPWLYAALVVSSVSTMLLVIQAQELKFVYDIAVLMANLAVYVGARYAGLDLLSTIMTFTAANIACYAIYLVIQFIALDRKLGRRIVPATVARAADSRDG